MKSQHLARRLRNSFICILCAALCSGCSFNAREKEHSRNATTSVASGRIQTLRKKHGPIRFGILGAESYESSEKMASFLQQWEPVGSSYDELLYLLGPPSERREGKEGVDVGYRIDSGITGTMYCFHLENGRVVRWRTVPID